MDKIKHQKMSGNSPEFSDAVLVNIVGYYLLLINDAINSHSGKMNSNRDSQSKNCNRY
ncbi:hypothetical protein [Sideroxydans sp. CL21]|nr:hypothetical protein [Sideroxydans sp. CL21]